MIRLAYLIDTISCATSGTERQLLETIRRLDKTQFEVTLICLHHSGWMSENKIPCNYTVLNYKGFIKPNIFGVIVRLCEILKDNNIQILQTFFTDSIFVAWLSRYICRRKIILLSSRRDIGLGKGNQPLYHELYKFLLPFVNKSFDNIIANSLAVKEYVAKHEKTSTDKIKVICNGVEIQENIELVPPIFKNKKAHVWIAIVASLSPVKRHDVLFNAIARLRGKRCKENIKVLVLGKGPEKERLVRLAEERSLSDIIHFEGAVHNVADYLKQVDFGVLCSDKEGLSNALLEYMANGLPVVATAVGGNTELVDEGNGICIPPGDSTALSDALLEMILNPQRRVQMGHVSRKKVMLRYTWQASMMSLETFYIKLIASKSVEYERLIS